MAPLDHCDEDGNLDYGCCFSSDTFAHVQRNGDILRYGQKIGVREDLKPVVAK